MQPARTGWSSGRLVFGLVLLALGLLFLAQNFGYLDADDYWRWWPLALVAIGVVKLLSARTTPERVAGLVWLVAGALLLAHSLDFMDFHIWDLWPIFLVLIGLRLVLGAVRGPSAPHGGNVLRAFAFMSGVGRKMDTSDFRGGDATAVMGGCEIDLRHASIASSPVVIDVFAFWGGIELFLPGDWSVSNEAHALLGAIEDSRREVAPDPKKHLIVRGMAIMGGVEFKS